MKICEIKYANLQFQSQPREFHHFVSESFCTARPVSSVHKSMSLKSGFVIYSRPLIILYLYFSKKLNLVDNEHETLWSYLVKLQVSLKCYNIKYHKFQ